MPQRPAHIPSLTPLRGIAAFGVLLFHFDGAVMLMGFAPLFPVSATHLVFRSYLWVDFFFILSGFVVTHVYAGTLAWPADGAKSRGYLLARFSRIYPLHLFCLGTHLLLLVAAMRVAPEGAEKLQNDMYAWEALPLHLTLLHAMNLFPRQTWNLPSWSIAAEWWTYVMAIGLIPAVMGGKRWRAPVAMAVGVVATLVMIELHPKNALRINFDYGWLRCLFEFTIGVGIYRLYREGWARQWFARDAAFVGAAVVALAALHFPTHDIWVLPAFGLVVWSAALNDGWPRKLLNIRPLRFFGDISYSFYMMQGFWMIVLGAALLHRKNTKGLEVPVTNQVIWLVVFFLLVFFSSWLSYRWVEVPARRFIRRRWGSTA